MSEAEGYMWGVEDDYRDVRYVRTIFHCSECGRDAAPRKETRYWLLPPTGWRISSDWQRWICQKCARRLNP